MEDSTSAASLFAGALDATALYGGSDSGCAAMASGALPTTPSRARLESGAATSRADCASRKEGATDPLYGGFGDTRLMNTASGEDINNFMRRGTAAYIIHSPSLRDPVVDVDVRKALEARRRHRERVESTKNGKLINELLEQQHRRGVGLLAVKNQSMGVIDHMYDAALPCMTKRWEAQYKRHQTTSVKTQKRAGEWAAAHRTWQIAASSSPSQSPSRSPSGKFSLARLRRGGPKVTPSPTRFHEAAQRRHSGINISTLVIDQIDAAEEKKRRRMGRCLTGLEKALDMHWLIDASGRVLELSDSLKRRVKADIGARAMAKKTERVPGWQIAALSRHKRTLIRRNTMSSVFGSAASAPSTNRVIKTKLSNRIAAMRTATGQFARDEAPPV